MQTYETYRQALKPLALPALLLDKAALLANLQTTLDRMPAGKTIRIATKSVRCVEVLRLLLEASPVMQGLMCFTAAEALFLSRQGFDNLLIGYPTVDRVAVEGLAAEVKQGKQIYFMADDEKHFDLLQQVGEQSGVKLSVCLDIDMSVDFPGLHFGVWRSPLRTMDKLKRLHEQAQLYPLVHIKGLMGYEAQVAGVGDNSPFQGIKNPLIRLLKGRSRQAYERLRQQAVAFLEEKGIALELVNGGGTGSVEWTGADASVSEITVGSAFFAGHLFDYYSQFHYKPALFFALPVVRIPKLGIYTCLGGGYVASGATGKEKQPLPFLPAGASLTDLEGAGEVMTPVVCKQSLQIGEPIFFRHAKSGEVCERFGEIWVIEKGEIREKLKTYRGEGQCFL